MVAKLRLEIKSNLIFHVLKLWLRFKISILRNLVSRIVSCPGLPDYTSHVQGRGIPWEENVHKATYEIERPQQPTKV